MIGGDIIAPEVGQVPGAIPAPEQVDVLKRSSINLKGPNHDRPPKRSFKTSSSPV